MILKRVRMRKNRNREIKRGTDEITLFKFMQQKVIRSEFKSKLVTNSLFSYHQATLCL